MEPSSYVELDLPVAPLSDTDLVGRIVAGEHHLFELVMRRHNQQLYRAARAIIGSDTDIEDILQQTYLNAFAHLEQFEARAKLSTWLTRIVINEAYARLRRRRVADSNVDAEGDRGQQLAQQLESAQPNPEQQTYAGELSRELEQAVDNLPEAYRAVFMLRAVEGMSTAETGTVLALRQEAVKTRLHRARAMLRRAVAARVGAAGPFQFHASRCDRVVAFVMRQLPA
jgi:RNA polymerase sigma-70 factor (ECF subfamily)